MKKVIKSKKEYHETMVAIYNLMNIGQSKLTKLEIKKITVLSIASEEYEERVLGLKPYKKPIA